MTVSASRDERLGDRRVRRPERDPDAGATLDLLAPRPERLAPRSPRCARHTAIAYRTSRDVLEQHGELVAAEAGDGVAGSDRLEALGDLDQERVAGIVPEAVVDQLEPVEVEEEHPDPNSPRRVDASACSSRSEQQPVR